MNEKLSDRANAALESLRRELAPILSANVRPAHRKPGGPDRMPESRNAGLRLAAHRDASHPIEAMFTLEMETAREELQVDLGRFLIEERGWPANAFTVHAVAMFATAVHRRYVRERGHEPEWDNGPVYRGFADYALVRATYDEEMGALAEQLAHEGGVR